MKDRHGMGDGDQVVQQLDACEPELDRDRLAVHGPRHVGQLGHIVEHRTSHAEAGGLDRWLAGRLTPQELADHRHQAVVLHRVERLDGDRRGPMWRFREEPEQCLGASDVSGEQHRGRL